MSDTAQIVRKYLVLAFILPLVLGCASMQEPSLHPNLPKKDPLTTPRVEFVGDDISIGLVAYANHQMWSCTDCASGATSGQLLAALPLTIAKKPDLVHILAGSYDMADPTWPSSGACNNDPAHPDMDTCANISAMMTQLKAAKIPFLVGSVLEWQAGTLANQLALPSGGVPGVQGNIFDFDRDIAYSLGGDPSVGVTIVDYYTNLPAADISGNGIDPNAAGYAVMLTLTQAAIDQTHTGELR